MNQEIVINELTFKAVRSSGAGGQNVNKVSSKVVLSFTIATSNGLNDSEKKLIISKLASRLTSDTVLILSCDEDRSQLKNKQIVSKRLLALLTRALVVPKKRKPTQIPKAVIMKRLKNKTNLSEIKKSRKKPNID
jgi:ribosome-associated protein